MQQLTLQLQNSCRSAQIVEPFPFCIVSVLLTVPEFASGYNVHSPVKRRRGDAPCSRMLHLRAAFAMKTGWRAANRF